MTDNPYSGKDPQQYIAALDALVGGRPPLEILAAQSDQLQSFFSGKDVSKFDLPETAGKWSITDVLHHLFDVELVYGYRVRQIAASNTPPIFPDMDQDLWAAARWYRDLPHVAVLAALAASRTLNLTMLRSLSDSQRARFGIHRKRGEESVDTLMVRWAGHDLVHLRQLKRIWDAVK
jgi:hypothetical protein